LSAGFFVCGVIGIVFIPERPLTLALSQRDWEIFQSYTDLNVLL
jgi:hypothetical protein